MSWFEIVIGGAGVPARYVISTQKTHVPIVVVFVVDMTSRAGTPAPPVTIANQDIRQGALGPIQNNTLL